MKIYFKHILGVSTLTVDMFAFFFPPVTYQSLTTGSSWLNHLFDFIFSSFLDGEVTVNKKECINPCIIFNISIELISYNSVYIKLNNSDSDSSKICI